MINPDSIRRFNNKIDKSNSCWLWTGGRDGSGFGNAAAWIDGEKKYVAAHRLAHIIYLGDIPSGMSVSQICKNKLCTNPNHLYLSGKEKKMIGKIVDLTGQRFGKWTVIEYTGKKDKKRGALWKCKCDCGSEKEVGSWHLQGGYSKSCGCIGHPKRRLDLQGKKFGRLIVLYYDHTGVGGAWWMCRCDCGTERAFPGSPVSNGYIKSCGCLTSRTDQEVYYLKYKSNAERFKREFTLSIDEFWSIVVQNCYLCGAPPSFRKLGSKGAHSAIVNGIDRVDNTKGYTLENSKPCCSMCNRAKMDHGLADWKIWLKRVCDTQFPNRNPDVNGTHSLMAQRLGIM